MKINNFSIGLVLASKNYLEEIVIFNDQKRIDIGQENIKDKFDGIETSEIIKFLKQITILKEENNFLIYNVTEDLSARYSNKILRILLTFFYKSQKKSSWVRVAKRGKAPVFERLASEGTASSKTILQSFQEAGLDDTQENINWWVDFQFFSQSLSDEEQDNINKSEIGLIGEILSIEYEKQKRKIKKPLLKSIEDSSLGYDIQSQISNNNSEPLFIEVKTSERGLEDAEAIITSNELKKAKTLNNYHFHFWDIFDLKKPKLAIIRKERIKFINENIDLGDEEINSLSSKFKTYESDFHIIEDLKN